MYAIAQLGPIHPRRKPAVGLNGPPHIARQIEAASHLAPAEAFRGHTALLLVCGDTFGCSQAERAVRDLWPVSQMEALACPIESWRKVLKSAPNGASWLQHYVLREIRRHAPSLVVLLDRGELSGSEEARTVATTFQQWGLAGPTAVLREDEFGGHEWLVAPADRRCLRAQARVPARPAEGWRSSSAAKCLDES